MFQLTGDDVFHQAASRWRDYDTFHRQCFAVAQKALFVIAVRSFNR
jgi:hypothetical protein